jgi:hypothetical protein
VSHGVAFAGPWPEGLVPGMNKGSGSGAVDLDCKLVMGVGCHCDWEVAGGSEGDSLKVVGCLGKVALAAWMVGVCC